MSKYVILVIIAVILFSLGCSGKEMITNDKIPPTKPVLIPHLGDAGNTADSIAYTDENNGIDAVPDVDGIRITWDHFLDLDLKDVKIWRYNDFSEPRVIATVPSTQESFTDEKNLTMNGDSLYYRYCYYIEVSDLSGNSTLSDTVAYRILEKQIPVYPPNGAVLANMYGLHFDFNRSGNMTNFRVLLFDDFHQLLWSYDFVGEEQTTYSIPYTGSVFTNRTLFWRVDAIDLDNNLWDGIHNIHGSKYIGSESHESTLIIQ
jgi:hypothetical protein